MKTFIENMKNKVLNNENISYKEVVNLYNVNHNDLHYLLLSANEIREKFMGNKFDLCSIMNAKSGRCSEDCKFCAQSIHYKSGIDEYNLLSYKEILKRALNMQEKGVHRFSLVTSGRGLEDKEFDDIVNIYKKLNIDTSLKLCASLGIIDYEKALKLKYAGVSMYHHNIETSRENFSSICTTHSFENRINTIKACKKAGLDICCGGIIGMNESIEDRINMAFEIKKLGVKSVPINILNPIKGTPFEEYKYLEEVDILKTMAIYRFILRDSYIRYAGGRMALKNSVIKGIKGGINSALVGDYLTTIGSDIEEDKKMVLKEDFKI